MKKDHETFMKRAIQLAKNGRGSTVPNPMVGCVIVRNSTIIGEGWHYKSGVSHAEVHAIQSVKKPTLLTKATLYITLEPCTYHGSPPCIDLILQKKIPRVVIGIQDPNPQVNGLGIHQLKEAGIEVIESVLKVACYTLNKRFFILHEKRRPYVLLKWAQSCDGFIDIPRDQSNPKQPFWFSNIYARQLVHKWRTEEDSVLSGIQTILNNNPQLSTRDWYGKKPICVILDRQLSIPESYSIYNNNPLTLVFTEKKKSSQKNVTFIPISFDQNLLKNLLDQLYKRDIQSVIIEDEKQILEGFIQEELWDEARIFIAEIQLSKGLKTPEIKGKIRSKTKIDTDTLLILTPD
ncbi:MAG: bifunctional diaminohydroxyphosphoribosylaminopyrimidine deaminase/5-amino-6-(5-phosphoribosylamino)uracil reductase RibD [Flavobacteriales bacterium AspAUS03]